MTPSEKLINAVISDNEKLTDDLLSQEFSGDTKLASEVLMLAIQFQSVKVLPCIARHCSGEGYLTKLYRNINRVNNHLDYVNIFSLSPQTVFSGRAYSDMPSQQRKQNLEMRLAIKPNYLLDERDILNQVIIDKDSGITFADFILEDIERFKQLSDFIKAIVFDIALYQFRYDVIADLLEHMSNIDLSSRVTNPIHGADRKDYGTHTLNNHYWHSNGKPKTLSVLIERHIKDTIEENLGGILYGLLPILKRQISSDEYLKFQQLAHSELIDNCLFSEAGIGAVKEMLSSNSYYQAHRYFISNTYRTFFVGNKFSDEQISCAQNIAKILKTHMNSLDENDLQHLTKDRYERLLAYAEDRRLGGKKIDVIKIGFDLILLEDQEILMMLLPEKRKCPLKSALANLEAEKWKSLAYYYLCTNYSLQETVYAYTPKGLMNEELAQTFLSLYGMTPYEALEVLPDENSQEALLGLMSK